MPTRRRAKLGSDRPTEEILNWQVGKLRQNPRQDENFHPLSEEEIGRLIESIERDGQRQAIEVLPDGTIIDGHQRWRAALALGCDTMRVIVRSDLAGDEAAIERRLIDANRDRRQLDTLDKVRVARRVEELKAKQQDGLLGQPAEQDFRDRIGLAMGMSGRHVQRYLNVLNTPMAVQRAVSEKKLSMALAEKVARLDLSAQDEIAAAIAVGGAPAKVVAAHLPASAPSEVDPDREYEIFLKAATRLVDHLDGGEGRVSGGSDVAREIEVLQQASFVIGRIISKLTDSKVLRARGDA